jgi:hypothetical protein
VYPLLPRQVAVSLPPGCICAGAPSFFSELWHKSGRVTVGFPLVGPHTGTNNLNY